MNWYSIDTWILVVGALAAMACALPGNFLVLRKMSMMGDAISHAVLPGLAIAFLITGTRASLTMFIGGLFVGVLTAMFTQWITRLGKVDEGASMGIVFTSLFALGLLLIVRAADHVDLDPDCVLYGAIELTPLDVAWRPELFGQVLHVPRSALLLAGVLFLNLVCTITFYKELKIASFDSQLASTLGMHPNRMHYLLMTQVAVTAIAAFEAVGSIIVIGMFVIPPATAYLLTDRLGTMIALSLFFALMTALLGHLSALIIPGWFGFASASTSGMMVVMAGCIFLVALLWAQGRSLWTRRISKGKQEAHESRAIFEKNQ